MAEEEEGSGESTGAETPKDAAPKKALPLLQIGLVLQLVIFGGAFGLITKAALFTKAPDLSEKTLRDRAIASVRDDSSKIQMLDLKDFNVNIMSHHVLRTNLQVEVSDEVTAAIMKKRMSAIKARVLGVLSEQSHEKAQTLQGKLLLKDAIRDCINAELLQQGNKKGVVREVYFMEFVLM